MIILNGEIVVMTDSISFKGQEIQIIAQLNKYMSKKDAKKFFLKHFNQNETVNNRNLKMPSSSAVSRHKMRAGDIRSNVAHIELVKSSRVQDHAIVCYQTTARKELTFPEIEQNSISIGNGNIRKNYSKKFTKVAFVCAAVALDIALYCTLGISFVGTAITAVTAVCDSLQKKEKSVALCIASIVEKQGYLPKYTTFRTADCKNLNMECSYHNGRKCNITKDVFVKVVNQLIKQEVLIVE